VRVLIVEDDPMLGDGLASGLRSLGFAVDWLTDGASADRALGASSSRLRSTSLRLGCAR
jgi:DNA-binding response OmpR family regulator